MVHSGERRVDRAAVSEERRLPPVVRAAAAGVAARLPVPEHLADQFAEAARTGNATPRAAEVFMRSPEAVARLLECARRFPGPPIDDLRDALARVDAVRLAEHLRAGATHSVLDPTPGPDGMSRLAYAYRSTEVADLTARICGAVGAGAAAGPAALAGLMHDIGVAVITAVPDDGDPAAGIGGRALSELAPRDHPLLGAWLAARWGLSGEIVRAIRCHEDPRPPARAVARSLWLAVRISEARAGVISGTELGIAGVQFGMAPGDLSQIALGDAPAPARCDLAGELTPRELDVLRMLADGMAPKQIARALRCAPSTVHNHLHHAYRKLGVANQAQAVLAAQRHGLV